MGDVDAFTVDAADNAGVIAMPFTVNGVTPPLVKIVLAWRLYFFFPIRPAFSINCNVNVNKLRSLKPCYDENAVTEAARLKGEMKGTEVIAVCVGKKEVENTVRSALAMGADRGVHIIADAEPDSIVTARALQTAIERDGDPVIIFTGKESIDNEGMQTMFRLAAAFDFPVATNVVRHSEKNKSPDFISMPSHGSVIYLTVIR